MVFYKSSRTSTTIIILFFALPPNFTSDSLLQNYYFPRSFIDKFTELPGALRCSKRRLVQYYSTVLLPVLLSVPT